MNPQWSLELLSDADEWQNWREIKDPVLHIELRRWADIFVIAPLDANTLAKIANGICDNLLTCIARCWDMNRPFVVYPAMNTLMWEHPVTAKHIDAISSFGIQVESPQSKLLACGDTGMGGMATVNHIVNTVVSLITSGRPPATPLRPLR